MKNISGLNIFQWNMNTFNSGRNMQIGGDLKKFSVRDCFCEQMMSSAFPLPDVFWLLFFHMKFHIPGSQAAFV